LVSSDHGLGGKRVCGRGYWATVSSIPDNVLKQAKRKLKQPPTKRGGPGSKREKHVKAKATIKSMGDLSRAYSKRICVVSAKKNYCVRHVVWMKRSCPGTCEKIRTKRLEICVRESTTRRRSTGSGCKKFPDWMNKKCAGHCPRIKGYEWRGRMLHKVFVKGGLTGNGIVKACQAAKMQPVCDSKAFSDTRCWEFGVSHLHISHPSHDSNPRMKFPAWRAKDVVFYARKYKAGMTKKQWSQRGKQVYIGCYQDNAARDFKHGPKRYGYQPSSCNYSCRGYSYFALQNGGWCSCDNTFSTPAKAYPRKPYSQCNQRGKGLGAGYRNAVYRTDTGDALKHSVAGALKNLGLGGRTSGHRWTNPKTDLDQVTMCAAKLEPTKIKAKGKRKGGRGLLAASKPEERVVGTFEGSNIRMVLGEVARGTRKPRSKTTRRRRSYTLIKRGRRRGKKPSCHQKIVNVAQRWGASQSDTQYGSGGRASRAVDGNVNGDFRDRSCTHTSSIGSWWKVKLERKFAIARVEIYNRSDCCGTQLRGAEVSVGWLDKKKREKLRKCGVVTKPAAVNKVQCDEKIGSFVKISMVTPGHFLVLCEVKVYAQRWVCTKGGPRYRYIGHAKKYRIDTKGGRRRAWGVIQKKSGDEGCKPGQTYDEKHSQTEQEAVFLANAPLVFKQLSKSGVSVGKGPTAPLKYSFDKRGKKKMKRPHIFAREFKRWTLKAKRWTSKTKWKWRKCPVLNEDMGSSIS